MSVSMVGNQRLRRDMARKKLRNILARTEKAALLQTMWLLDRAWYDPNFQRPAGYDFPPEAFASKFGDPHAIYPWEFETLITELLCVRRNMGRRTGNPKSWNLISTAVNCLRTIEDAEYALHAREEVLREMSRIRYRQLRWQPHNWQGAEYVRWWSIFREEPLAGIFERLMGVTVDKFLAVGISWNHIFNSNWRTLRIQNSDIPHISEEDIDAVVRALSAPVASLQRSSLQTIIEAETTAYRRGVLRGTPVIEFTTPRGPEFARPIELLLKWRLSSGLYYDVIGDREVRDRNLIGLAFEQYIRDLFDSKFQELDVTGDLPYGTAGRQKKTPDVLASRDNCVQLVLECKAIKLPLSVQTSIGDTPERSRAIEDLANGVKQVCEFEELLSSGIPELDLEYSDELLSVVVTLDDWLFSGHDVKSDIMSRARKLLDAEGRGDAVHRVDRVVLCTADEIEKLVTVYDTAGAVNVLRKSLTVEHRGSPLGAVMTDCRDGRVEHARNPLSERVGEFLRA